ncbi:hypothetical protein XPA_006577 [Xanthoria parietina]
MKNRQCKSTRKCKGEERERENYDLAPTAIISYTLGLRHAIDADHIVIIDLVTRRLVASGQKPVAVGTFFSLGHSTIVIITSIVVAATAAAISEKFGTFSRVGGIIGTAVSAAVLILLAVANSFILWKLVRQLRGYLAGPGPVEGGESSVVQGYGCMFGLLRRLFRLIDRSWKMYPLGVLFGAGFDTSSEIALLGIASIQGVKGTSIWLILIFPVLFTAGMCLLDTVDGALMMSLYTSTALANDRIAILYYSIVLTLITVVVAMIIGFIQLLSLIANVSEPSGKFWEGVAVAGDHYDVIGGGICGSFVVFGALSILLYKPWRKRFDKRRRSYHQSEHEPEADEMTEEAVRVPIGADEHGNLAGGFMDEDRMTAASRHGQVKS